MNSYSYYPRNHCNSVNEEIFTVSQLLLLDPPLSTVCAGGQVGMVKMLLENGPEVDFDYHGRGPVIFEASINGHVEIVKLQKVLSHLVTTVFSYFINIVQMT